MLAAYCTVHKNRFSRIIGRRGFAAAASTLICNRIFFYFIINGSVKSHAKRIYLAAITIHKRGRFQRWRTFLHIYRRRCMYYVGPFEEGRVRKGGYV